MLARGNFETSENFAILAQQRGGAGFSGTVEGENIHAPMIEDEACCWLARCVIVQSVLFVSAGNRFCGSDNNPSIAMW